MIEVSETDEGFSHWIERPFVLPELQEHLAKVSVLLFPGMEAAGQDVPSFPVGTESLLQYLRANLGPDAVDLAIDDDKYTELALHADIKRIGHIIVAAVVAPLVINLLSSYIYDTVQAKPADQIELRLTVVKPKSSVDITFKGTADEFVKSGPEIERLSK